MPLTLASFAATASVRSAYVNPHQKQAVAKQRAKCFEVQCRRVGGASKYTGGCDVLPGHIGTVRAYC